MEEKKKLIPRGKIIHAALIWETWVQTCYNYERMMGIACAITFLPVVKYLYPGDLGKQIEVMQRQAKFKDVAYGTFGGRRRHDLSRRSDSDSACAVH